MMLKERTNEQTKRTYIRTGAKLEGVHQAANFVGINQGQFDNMIDDLVLITRS